MPPSQGLPEGEPGQINESSHIYIPIYAHDHRTRNIRAVALIFVWQQGTI